MVLCILYAFELCTQLRLISTNAFAMTAIVYNLRILSIACHLQEHEYLSSSK